MSKAIAPSAAPRGTPAPTVSSISASALRAQAVSRPEASVRPQVLAAEPQIAPAQKISSFAQLVALAGEKRDLLTKAALETDVRLVRIEDGRLEVALEPNASRTMVNELSRKLEQWTKRRWAVIVSNETGQPTLREQNLVMKSERERAAEADPRVKEVFARFPGSRIVEVRRLAAEPPDADVPLILRVRSPVFVRVIGRGVLVVPTAWSGNRRLVGESETAGGLVPTPLPRRPIDCGLAGGLSVNCRDALRAPLTVGVKTIFSAQLCPPGRLEGQEFD